MFVDVVNKDLEPKAPVDDEEAIDTSEANQMPDSAEISENVQVQQEGAEGVIPNENETMQTGEDNANGIEDSVDASQQLKKRQRKRTQDEEFDILKANQYFADILKRNEMTPKRQRME